MTVKRSPQGKEVTTSGVFLGFAKTCVSSGWVEQSTYATPSAQAAEAARRHPPSRISNRLRSIAPSSARGHPEPLDRYRAWTRVRQMARGPGFAKAVLDEMPGPLRVPKQSGRCRKVSRFGKRNSRASPSGAWQQDACGCQIGSKRRIFYRLMLTPRSGRACHPPEDSEGIGL